jgi:hypothetical protein
MLALKKMRSRGLSSRREQYNSAGKVEGSLPFKPSCAPACIAERPNHRDEDWSYTGEAERPLDYEGLSTTHRAL